MYLFVYMTNIALETNEVLTSKLTRPKTDQLEWYYALL